MPMGCTGAEVTALGLVEEIDAGCGNFMKRPSLPVCVKVIGRAAICTTTSYHSEERHVKISITIGGLGIYLLSKYVVLRRTIMRDLSAASFE